MTLKAKLEAVIYAAEEPVTLAQFATLFAEDALAWKAEREAQSVLLGEGTESANADGDAPLEIVLADAGIDAGAEVAGLVVEGQTASLSDVPTESPEDVPLESAVGGSEAGLADEPAADAIPWNAAPPAEDRKASDASPVVDAQAETAAEVVDPVAEAKRLERKREREVRETLREALDELIAEYAQDSRGIEIREIAGGFRMGTKPEIHDAVRAFVKSLKPPMKLSLPALETLAVVAYKQPVTAPEVGEIRGVDSAGVLGSLMSRKLIATAGRKQVIGRPIQYKTTKEFLLRFGLKDLNELPSMEEFEKMAAMELSEETLDEEMDATPEPAEQSGDLFEQEEAAVEAAVYEQPAAEMEAAEAEVSQAVVESPEAQMEEPVERQHAEEVEVKL